MFIVRLATLLTIAMLLVPAQTGPSPIPVETPSSAGPVKRSGSGTSAPASRQDAEAARPIASPSGHARTQNAAAPPGSRSADKRPAEAAAPASPKPAQGILTMPDDLEQWIRQSQPAGDLPLPSPILIGPPPTEPPPAQDTSPLRSASEAIKVILGLVLFFGLAYLGGHPKIQAMERKLRISQVVTAGLPFVFIGVLAHLRPIGILSPSVLWEVRPLLALGLGWIGFTIGFRFDSRLVESLVPGSWRVSLLTTSIPYIGIVGACAALLLFVEHSPTNRIFLRDAMILATAGAMTAYSAPILLRDRGGAHHQASRIESIVHLEQLAGVVGLMFVAAYFRPQGASVAWHLPGTAWLFITVGLGTIVGGVLYGTLSNLKAGPEFSLLMLGSIAFTAGLAGFLRLSPLVVCFIVGLILVNMPGGSKQQIREALERMERPIYLIFLVVAGSLWDVTEWQGWALMVLFVAARLLGKWVSVVLCRKSLPGGISREEEQTLIYSPLGALSIAMVVSAQDLYFGPAVSWIVTAVIGAAVVTEVIVQFAFRRITTAEPVTEVI